jgi:hypothetical protein
VVPQRRRLTTIRTPRRLKKTFEKKSLSSKAAILECVKKLRVDPRDPSLRTKKLSGRTVRGQPVFEARVTDGDRVTFYWDGEVIILENHCTHQQVLGR